MVHVWALKVILGPLFLWAFIFYLFVLTSLLGVGGLARLVPWIAYGLGIVAVGYLWATLYRRYYRWRTVSEELQIWRGILFRKRITIPFMRVQNVNVVRGPLLLIFGLSAVEVETAGQRGHYSTFYRTEGYIPGLTDGEDLADRILKRVREIGGRGGV